jgi:hypothetical protein
MMPGVSALAFLPSNCPFFSFFLYTCSDNFLLVGIGAIFACGIFFWYDTILLRAQINNKDWAKSEEGRRLPLACLAGPIFAISLFWLVDTPPPTLIILLLTCNIVGLDLRSKYPVDNPNARRTSIWNRLPSHLHDSHKLPY